MAMSTLLNPKAVRFVSSATSKKRLFQSIAEVAQSVYGLDTESVISALQERESLGPTGVGHGVAVPHARVDGIDKVLGVFFRLEKPLDYGSVDKAPVDLVFALFAPRDAGVEHLKALAFISRTLRNAQTCEKLRANEDPAKIHAILSSIESSKAA
ncbi:PTS system nitrogen regulatory IIA component [Roseinatronobacter thiooxidans]|jgi:nitrogen PTS system EIIA component|uniref:PTS system nitrogen regulatory IIA component n=1 Tax=Roseinatronobacter thiooxidans TaxID=121821 RepID=A0A2W7QA73_9RHOB|nr:PTS sugar transporter subunit IIA [Roseinatronobacter thiooxidans]PZX44546.1 PTS system nitrogen regulatory IIA component [Roseinatronobacter thiooxidans]